MLSRIESAAYVMFGDFHQVEDVAEYHLATTETPETKLMQKELLKGLSDEGVALVKTILNLPSEFFLEDDSVVNGGMLYNICREQFGWSIRQTRSVKKEVRFFLLALNPAARNRGRKRCSQ